jgi:hypothetical protein
MGDAVSLGSAFPDSLFGPKICFLAFCFRLFFIRYQEYFVLICLIFNKRIFKEKLDRGRSDVSKTDKNILRSRKIEKKLAVTYINRYSDFSFHRNNHTYLKLYTQHRFTVHIHMDAKTSKKTCSAASDATITKTASSHGSSHLRRRMVQNDLLIWVDPSIDEANKDCQDILVELRTVANNVSVFTERDGCVDFLTDVKDIKVLLIAGDTVGQQILPLIHDIPQLHGVYIFCLPRAMDQRMDEGKGHSYNDYTHMQFTACGSKSMQPRFHRRELRRGE